MSELDIRYGAVAPSVLESWTLRHGAAAARRMERLYNRLAPSVRLLRDDGIDDPTIVRVLRQRHDARRVPCPECGSANPWCARCEGSRARAMEVIAAAVEDG
jgi:hypothetical protein